MFLLEYIKDPRTVGAVAASSKHLANGMVENIDFEKAKYIAEFGPGNGAFTEKLLSRVKEDTIVILVEVNVEFYNILKSLYGHKKNVIIINDSAENIDVIMKEYNIDELDYIISGIPFTSLPKEISNNILQKTKEVLAKDASFITFQYSLLKMNLFNEFFKDITHERVVLNIPPAYVLNCKVTKNN